MNPISVRLGRSSSETAESSTFTISRLFVTALLIDSTMGKRLSESERTDLATLHNETVKVPGEAYASPSKTIGSSWDQRTSTSVPGASERNELTFVSSSLGRSPSCRKRSKGKVKSSSDAKRRHERPRPDTWSGACGCVSASSRSLTIRPVGDSTWTFTASSICGALFRSSRSLVTKTSIAEAAVFARCMMSDC